MVNYFIIGVSSGFGRAITLEVCPRSGCVCEIARRKELLAKQDGEIGDDHFFYSACDPASPSEISSSAEAMRKARFVPAVVVLNSGFNPEAKGESFS